MDIILRETADKKVWEIVVDNFVVGRVKPQQDATHVLMSTGASFDLPEFDWQEGTENFRIAVSEIAACVAKSRVTFENLNESARAFAEACYHGFDSDALKAMVHQAASNEEDCRTWGLDDEEWGMAVMAAWNRQLGVKSATSNI